jgi:hypothetical protein
MISSFVGRAFFVFPECLAILVRIPVVFDSGFQQLVFLICYGSLHLNQLKPFVIQFWVFRFPKSFWLSQYCIILFDFRVGSSLQFMPAEADLFSLEIFFSSQNSKVVAFNVGVILHEILDVLEVLVDPIDAIVS